MNPYEVLGVDPNADAPIAMSRGTRIPMVHDILIDEDRRRKYDATGDDSEKTPDNSMLQLVNVALDEALGEIETNGRKAWQASDLLKLVKGNLLKQQAKIRADLLTIRKAIQVNETLIGRFGAKEKGADNLMEALIRGRIGLLRGMIANAERQIEGIANALNIVHEYTFRADREDQAGKLSMFSVWTAMGATTG